MARLLFRKGKCCDAATRKEEKSCHRSLHKYQKTVVSLPCQAADLHIAGSGR